MTQQMVETEGISLFEQVCLRPGSWAAEFIDLHLSGPFADGGKPLDSSCSATTMHAAPTCRVSSSSNVSHLGFDWILDAHASLSSQSTDDRELFDCVDLLLSLPAVMPIMAHGSREHLGNGACHDCLPFGSSLVSSRASLEHEQSPLANTTIWLS